MYDTIVEITERNFRGEILIYLLESCAVVFFENIQICIQFYNLQQLLLFYDCCL